MAEQTATTSTTGAALLAQASASTKPAGEPLSRTTAGPFMPHPPCVSTPRAAPSLGSGQM
jgi:hypothetical protein